MTRRFFWLLIAMASISGRVTAQQAGNTASANIGVAADSQLVQRERAQWEALKARDASAFARLMGANVVDVDVSGIRVTSPASTSQYVRGCQTRSFTLSDVRVAHYAATAVVTYKAAVEATCWGQKAPSPLYMLTVYEQHGDTWQPVAHAETPAAHW